MFGSSKSKYLPMRQASEGLELSKPNPWPWLSRGEGAEEKQERKEDSNAVGNGSTPLRCDK